MQITRTVNGRSPEGGRFAFGHSLGLALCLALSLLGCSSDQAASKGVLAFEGLTMGTTYHIKLVAELRDDADREAQRAGVEEAVAAALLRLDGQFSTYNPKSLVSLFNARASTQPFPVDAEFVALVRQSLTLAERSSGAFDITILPLMTARGFGPKKEQKGDEVAVQHALTLVDYHKLEITAEQAVRKLDPAIELDFNAIAKGYGVDVLCDRLRDLGYAAAMVEIGGEVRCFGVKPDGKAWAIGIETPDGGSAQRIARLVIPLADQALATSGSYRQFHESNGSKRHHILDPRSGDNGHGAAVSVSVRASTCALADALATTLMILGHEAAGELLESYAPEKIGVLFLLRGADGVVVEKRVNW